MPIQLLYLETSQIVVKISYSTDYQIPMEYGEYHGCGHSQVPEEILKYECPGTNRINNIDLLFERQVIGSPYKGITSDEIDLIGAEKERIKSMHMTPKTIEQLYFYDNLPF